MRGAGVAIASALALGACSGGGGGAPGGAATPAVTVPARAATAGDRLLAWAPAGAALVLEVDLARLRANPVVGATVAGLVDRAGAPPAAQTATWLAGLEGAAPLAGAEAVLLAAYRIGGDDATAVTIVAGGTKPAAAIALDDRVWALADEGQTAALLATAGGGASAADDAALMALRAAAMPAAAEGASVRLAARLDAAAQASLADALGLDAAPASISLWGDVADDLALIAWLGAAPADAGGGAARLLAVVRARLAAVAELRALGLGPPVEAATIARDRDGARGVIVIGPQRLARALARWHAVRPPP